MAARRRTADEWREIVERWRSSGRSKEDYARKLGVSPITLGWWQWKLACEAPEPTTTPRFAEVVVVETAYVPRPAPDLVIEIGDLRVRVPSGFDAGELRRLVSALC
jgi:transposase-like protein